MAGLGKFYAGAGGDPGGEPALKAFAAQVKLLRERAGLTQAEFGGEIGYSMDLVRSVEFGRRFPTQQFVRAAECVLDAGGLLQVAHEQLCRSTVRYPPWFRDFAELEASAVNL